MEYKNNQTTSTKCQYHAAHSNPMICSGELIIFLNRFRDTTKKIDPMITWRPWNPVAIKNLDPKEESAIENGASAYSNAWNAEKIIPKNTVNVNEIFDLLKLFFSISWWDHVTVTPEERRRIVFRSGIPMGLNGWIDKGGHLCPNSIVGEILLWKKAQKKDTKKNTSDVINRIIPVFSPFITIPEWFPWVVDSRCTSRHHE